MPFDFNDAAYILGMDDRTTDDMADPDTWEPCPPVPADEKPWELRIYSDRPVFNLARIVREIDPAYEVEVIER